METYLPDAATRGEFERMARKDGVGERSEFFTRDYSNRLQEIEREIEREARNEENEREEYTKE